MSLHWADVAQSLAALDIRSASARIPVLDVHELPQGLTNRPLPLLAPAVDRAFLSDWTATRITTAGNHQNAYTLNYAFYQAPFAKGRGAFEPFQDTVENVEAVLSAIQALPRVAGCKRIEVAGVPQVGLVRDASDQQFHGAIISLRVTEF